MYDWKKYNEVSNNMCGAGVVTMQALKCDMCGGNLIVDDSGLFSVCESCGARHSKERIQRKLEEVKISGPIEVSGIQNADKIVENAQSFKVIGEWEKAKRAYKNLTDNYPNDYRGWWGLIECQTRDFDDVLRLDDECNIWFSRAINFCHDNIIKSQLENTYNVNWNKKQSIEKQQEQERTKQLEREAQERESVKAETIAKNKAEAEAIKKQNRIAVVVWLVAIGLNIIFLYTFYNRGILQATEQGAIQIIIKAAILWGGICIIVGIADALLSGCNSGVNILLIIVSVIIAISFCVYAWRTTEPSFINYVFAVPFGGLIVGGAAALISLTYYIGSILRFFRKK